MSTLAYHLSRGAATRYLFALGAVATAFALRMLLAPLMGRGAPFVLFFAAILLTGLFAGTGPGVVALLISLPLAAYIFAVPAGYSPSEAVFHALLYAIDGLIILYLTHLTTRRRRRLDTANAELVRLSSEAARSAEHTHEVIELAPDAFFLANLDARFTDVNREACRLLGYERDELVGMTIFDIIPAEDAARLEATRRELLRPGAAIKSEWRLKRKDGTLVPVEVSANILDDGRWQAFVRDITERKRIEDQQQVFVSLLDNSVDFIGIADPTGKPIYLNAAGRRMIGLTPDFPVEEIQIQDCYPAEIRSFVTDVLLKTMVERGVWSGDTFFRNFQTDEHIPVSDTHFLIRDASGERVLGMGTVTRDISETRRHADERERLLAGERTARRELEAANARLRESEERFRGIVSIASDAIVTVDADQRITVFNEGAEQIFGYSKQEIIGTSLERLIPSRYRTRHRAAFAAFGAGTESARTMAERLEVFGLRKSGEEFPAEASISKVTVGTETLFSVVLRDITHRKRVEEALERALGARDEVLGIVAHDLRNPLSTIMLTAHTMARRPGNEPDRRDAQPPQMILGAAKRMNRLIQDLLDVALVEAGQLKVELAPLAAEDLARNAVDMQRPLAAASEIEIGLEVAPDVETAWGDRQRLLQVFENLIGNAIKFTQRGGRITVRASVQDQDVMFSVTDTGVGIAPDAVPHVFDRFWQATTRAGRLGAGLGLPITKGIIEAHGGRIQVKSEVGRGTTFTFTIPASQPSAVDGSGLVMPGEHDQMAVKAGVLPS